MVVSYMKTFTTTGVCTPENNYMVDISDRIKKMKVMVDEGKYFIFSILSDISTIAFIFSILSDISTI